MAASCICVSVSTAASLVVCRSVEFVGSSKTVRSPAAPSVSSFSCKSSAGYGFFSSGKVRMREGGIASRAVELDETNSASSADEEIQEEESPAAPAPSCKLYVGNVPWSADSKSLAELFQEHGNVELVEVIYDRDTQKSRGFAFVTMGSREDAEKAIQLLNNYEFQGRPLKVNFPQTSKDGPRSFRNERPPSRERRDGEGYASRTGGSFNRDSANKIFIGNLSWGVDDVALTQLFSEYGQVVEAKVIHDKETGRSRGFAFATMSKPTEVDTAISALDGAEFDGRILRVNHAGDKPERRDSPRREY